MKNSLWGFYTSAWRLLLDRGVECLLDREPAGEGEGEGLRVWFKPRSEKECSLEQLSQALTGGP